MRVIERFRREESGAVLMIAAICLLVLLGMLVLTVDLGRMVAVKRSMVRAADAAALAAAQQCALGNGTPAASTAANQTALANQDDVTRTKWIIDDAACRGRRGNEFVTVEYSATLDMFFAPIFGIDTSDVVAEATATWSIPRPVPITVNAVPLEACKVEPDDECTLSYLKDDLSEPRWGTLDLSVWGQQVSRCPVPASTINEIIQAEGWSERLIPNPPAYDCLDNGRQFSSWEELEGRTLWFPVIDIEKSLGEVKPGHGEACTGADIPALKAAGKDCQITTAWIIEFQRMHVLDVHTDGSTTVLTTELERSASSIPGIEIRLVD